jgi:ubiquinone biosynthesis protein COQ4
MLFNLSRRLQSLRMVASLATFLKNPTELDSVLGVARSLQGSPLASHMQRHLLENPAMAALVAEGWRPAPIDLDRQAAMPEGSLGRTYAEQLQRLNLTPESLIDPRPITTPSEYITHRLRETHDIIHVLGLIFGGLLGTLQDDEPLEPLLRALARGFAMGLEARCLITFKLEEGWERPLADWRRELGLPDAPSV